jgi:hypothetical protein
MTFIGGARSCMYVLGKLIETSGIDNDSDFKWIQVFSVRNE